MQLINTYNYKNKFKTLFSFKQLSNKQNELEGEVFEVLSTFTNFMAFKEMFLDYRAVSNKNERIKRIKMNTSIII